MAVPKDEVGCRIRRFEQEYRRRGLRITHQRSEIFRELAATDKHPDAEALYRRVVKRVPAVSRDTVYRTLATLEAQGLVSRTAILGGPARYDANTDRHHHFVCTRCGAVKDFHSKAFDALPIPQSARALGRVGSAHMQVRGLCSACIGRNAKRR